MSKFSWRDTLACIAIIVMFGSALYIRHLAKMKGRWNDFLYSFSGNLRFYLEFWREIRKPLLLMGIAILTLIGIIWSK